MTNPRRFTAVPISPEARCGEHPGLYGDIGPARLKALR